MLISVINTNSERNHCLGDKLGSRVKFVDEGIFPFNGYNVSEYMYDVVKEKGVYPLNGKSPFEHTIWGKTGWFLQQLLKFYAGIVLDIDDFLLLDSDVVWFKNITLINSTATVNGVDGSPRNITKYNYACSSQYHPAYMASLTRISGQGVYEAPDKIHRSGIVHHMVIVKEVLAHLMNDTESRYQLPFWKILLNER